MPPRDGSTRSKKVPIPIGPIIDTHAHLDDPKLSSELPAILARAAEAGVQQIVAISTTAQSGDAVLQIADQHQGVFAAVGVQPNHVAEATPGDWDQVVEQSKGNRHVVAIGETGLDRYWDFTPFAQQQAWFDRHLELALERDLPVVIHCRDCESDLVKQLERVGRPIQGVLHSFTGNQDQAEAFLALGLHLSLAGMVTFRNASLDPLRDAATQIPLDRVLVETDSPYLSPQPHRGKPNEPARVVFTATYLASLRKIESSDFAEATTANARRLFKLPENEHLATESSTAS